MTQNSDDDVVPVFRSPFMINRHNNPVAHAAIIGDDLKGIAVSLKSSHEMFGAALRDADYPALELSTSTWPDLDLDHVAMKGIAYIARRDEDILSPIALGDKTVAIAMEVKIAD